MKKYLIKGALALFAGAFMVSCAEKESDFVPLAEQKAKAFEEVFKELYGEIDPYQDWGFSSGKIEIDPNDSSIVVEVVDLDANVAYTRAAAFGKTNTLLAFDTGNTRAANTNANQWAQTYNVPDPLTAGQKARVQFYFQTVKNPGGTEDKGQIDFFVQQVYDGCTDPITKYTGYLSPAYSKEEYPAANNSTMIQSGEHMDHLTAGSDNVHINNFNNGTCSTNCNVGDNGAALDTKQHCDEIMLMLNTKTDCFGYANSDASYVRKDRYRLVAGSVIDQYITDNYTAYKAWLDQHTETIKDEIVDDMWHRGFIGFDFDMLPDAECYDGTYALYSALTEANDKRVFNENGQVTTYTSGNDKLIVDGKEIPYVSTQTNKYCAIGEHANIGIGGEDGFNDYATIGAYSASGSNDNTLYLNNLPGEQSDKKAINMKFIAKLVRAGYLPIANKSLKRWVKIGGCNDGYYSDWIVSFKPAGDAPEPSYKYPIEKIDEWWMVEKGRVFCEDLGQASREDLDYNDVVFDAYIFKNHYKYTQWKQKWVNGKMVEETLHEGPTEHTKYYANVEILAAGGTIPVTIQSNILGSTSYQVHDQFSPKASIETMINTRDNKSTAYGSFDVRNPVQLGTIEKHFEATLPDGSKKNYNVSLFEIDTPKDESNIKEIQNIKIKSSFGTAKQIQDINSIRGEVPRKFMAPIETKWTSERKNISWAYPKFGAWVGGGAAPWNDVETNYTYNEPYDANGLKLPLVMKARSTINTEGEQDLWHGTEDYRSQWSLNDLSLTLPSDAPKFYAGDRLRFYAENISDDAWITVVIGSIQPYFVNSEFPNYILDSEGNRTEATSGCVEVLLDQESTERLNSQVSDGKVVFQVQGQGFILTRICRVEFE